MPDREKYIEVLSKTAKTVKEFNEDAPIKISLECIEDILELLKEQEAVEPKSHPAKAWTRAKTLWFCGACGARISKRKTKYCQECGTAVKWT